MGVLFGHFQNSRWGGVYEVDSTNSASFKSTEEINLYARGSGTIWTKPTCVMLYILEMIAQFMVQVGHEINLESETFWIQKSLSVKGGISPTNSLEQRIELHSPTQLGLKRLTGAVETHRNPQIGGDIGVFLWDESWEQCVTTFSAQVQEQGWKPGP